MKPTDSELVESACHGDPDSFRILYERHWPLAVALACSRLRDRHLAEDVAQDSFVIACRQLNTLNDGERFPQWLGTIVRRTAGTTRGSNANEEHLVEPESRSEVANDHEDVRSAIGQLSEAQREVIYMRYFSDLSHQEIATAIGGTTGSVHGLLQRARRAIAKRLGNLTRK